MFDIRCANCGSPHIKEDKENNGIKYNSAKGVAGAVVFGSGGAALGFENDTKTVYKCPDCGMTLSYTMPYDMARVIDLARISDDVNRTISFGNYHMSWKEIKARYKNAGENVREKTMASLAQNPAVINMASMFKESVDIIRKYSDLVFPIRKRNEPLTEKEYKEYVCAIDTFGITISSFFISKGIDDREKLGKEFPNGQSFGFDKYYANYLIRCFEKKFLHPFGLNPEEDVKALFDYDKDIPKVLKCLFWPFDESAYRRTYISIVGNATEYRRLSMETSKNKIYYLIFPKFQLRDDGLYYSDWAYSDSPFTCFASIVSGKDSYEEDSIKLKMLKEKYFSSFPEKESEYTEKENEYKSALQNNIKIKTEIEKAKKEYPSKLSAVKTEISSLEQMIEKEKSHILFKKKAAQKIDELSGKLLPKKQKLSEIEAEYNKILSQKEKELPSEEEFYQKLIISMDYLQIWHKA